MIATDPLDVHQHDPSMPLPTAMKTRLAGPFGTAADGYRRFRPGYPADAVAAAVGPRPGAVLDLGAGTGKLAAGIRSLPDSGVTDLIAVEPDPQMLAALRTVLPGITALAGSAERIPVPDASADVCVVGQAMHWFDLDTALPEIARVLRPGGRLGLLVFVADGPLTPPLPEGNEFPSEPELLRLLDDAGFELHETSEADLGDSPAEWAERADAVDAEVERRHGDDPEFQQAQENAKRVGRLLSGGELRPWMGVLTRWSVGGQTRPEQLVVP
jgi:SAM-dependent methyltransferase